MLGVESKLTVQWFILSVRRRFGISPPSAAMLGNFVLHVRMITSKY